MQVVNADTIARYHNTIKRLLPVLRSKNKEEIDHIKSVNLLNLEQQAIKRNQNEAELKHKDEIQKRLRIEREEYLEFEQKKHDLIQKKRRWETHRRSTVDPNETESDSN